MKITKIGSAIRNLVLTLLAVGLLGFGNTAKAECLTERGTRISVFDYTNSSTNKMAKATVVSVPFGIWSLHVWFDSFGYGGRRYDVHMYTEYKDAMGNWYLWPGLDKKFYNQTSGGMITDFDQCMNFCPLEVKMWIYVYDPVTKAIVSWNYAFVRQPPPPPPTN